MPQPKYLLMKDFRGRRQAQFHFQHAMAPLAPSLSVAGESPEQAAEEARRDTFKHQHGGPADHGRIPVPFSPETNSSTRTP